MYIATHRMVQNFDSGKFLTNQACWENLISKTLMNANVFILSSSCLLCVHAALLVVLIHGYVVRKS